MNGAQATGSAGVCAQICWSSVFWIASAPGTVSTSGGSPLSGMSSLKFVNVAFGTAL